MQSHLAFYVGAEGLNVNLTLLEQVLLSTEPSPHPGLFSFIYRHSVGCF